MLAKKIYSQNLAELPKPKAFTVAEACLNLFNKKTLDF